MDKEPSIINNANQNEAARKEIERDFSVKNLAGFLKYNKLNMNIVKQEAEKLNVKAHELGYEILIEAGLEDEYFEYSKKIGGYSSDNQLDILSGFFEKFQWKPEITPAEIEQEPEVEVAEVVPEIQEPTSEPTTPQEAKTPKALKEPEISSPEPIPPAKTAVQPPENLPIEETIETIPNPGRRNWQEVKRETEVMAIEDLSGSMKTFEEHVTRLGVAKKDATGNWQWTGGNKKLVFLGDILGDYEMNGIEITGNIFDLARQAEKDGGKIDMLCGNHDAMFIDFLCQNRTSEYFVRNARDLYTLFSGVRELAQYDPTAVNNLREIELARGKNVDEIEKSTSLDSPGNAAKYEKIDEINESVVSLLYERMPLILDNMKTSSEGRKILENISQIKAAVVYDDTLFCHTDPTTRMITDLTRDGNIAQRVSEVNKIFQDNLRKTLFEGAKLGDDFNLIEGIYLNTSNREYFVENESFESLAKNLLVELIENLYKNKRIKFNQEIENDLNKNGFKDIRWNEWKRILSENLSSANASIEENDIEKWKEEKGIEGDYVDEIGRILEKLIEIRKTSDAQKREIESGALDNLFESMVKKIKNLNLVGKIQKVRNSGINAIIHGHSPHSDPDRYYDENGLVIVSPHARFQRENFGYFENGISIIKTNGKIDLSGKVFRDK